MTDIALQLGDGRSINGICKPGFGGVLAAFRINFEQHNEIGASLCLTHQGKTVVDLWGGLRDPETGAEWDSNTVSIVYSCTKGATALCAHILAVLSVGWQPVSSRHCYRPWRGWSAYE